MAFKKECRTNPNFDWDCIKRTGILFRIKTIWIEGEKHG